MRRVFVSIFVFVFLVVLVSASWAAGKNVTIVVTDNGWDSQKFHNAVAKLVVERAYDGYKLETSTASSTMNWQAMIAGDVDLDIESWTDNVKTYATDIARGEIVELGVLVPDSAQGFYVPRYVIEGDSKRGIKALAPELKTVADLAKYPHVFVDEENRKKGRVYGSIPGWMADEVLYKKFRHLNLDKTFNYVRLGSEATLFASLVSAYNLGQPWVGYCYEPTWVSGKLDLVLLNDAPYNNAAFLEGKTAFPAQKLKIVSSNQFAKRAPELVSFFKNYQTGKTLVAESLAYLEATKASHEKTAVWFLKKNDALIAKWLPAQNAEKLRAYLKTVK